MTQWLYIIIHCYPFSDILFTGSHCWWSISDTFHPVYISSRYFFLLVVVDHRYRSSIGSLLLMPVYKKKLWNRKVVVSRMHLFSWLSTSYTQVKAVIYFCLHFSYFKKDFISWHVIGLLLLWLIIDHCFHSVCSSVFLFK